MHSNNYLSHSFLTIQATEADKIYMYYYLLYQLQVFHYGNHGNRPASTPVPEEQVNIQHFWLIEFPLQC